MLRIIVACTNGMGTSQMIKMKVEKLMKAHEIDCTVSHSSIGEAKKAANNVDVVFCPLPFTNAFDSAAEKGVKIIGVRNLLSEKEIDEKIVANIIDAK